ncbi:phosphoglycerate mutase family 5 [Lentilactobacillus kosonis]|uniref:Phosphoglycerate mutase family 5 n=1 Tax=Lentilactobacillus kosonis TaxID=2810561 RepID=A0A401FP90_9LACO|nr:phosphoglycerate mutase family 5 [Lentilactobacillus kosonis]
MKSRPQITLLSRLAEFNLGKMEGMKFTEVQEQYPEEFINFRNYPDKYDPIKIGGESYPDVIERMTPAIMQIVTEYPTENVMIVSHGAALNAEMNHLLGASLPNLKKRGGLANTSTTTIETKNAGQSFELISWNDTTYLNRRIDKTDIV